MKIAVFSCLGLGDGLLALILSNNLAQNGDEVTTFHPSLSSLQPFFPHLPLRPFPPLEELSQYDRFFIFYEKSEWMQRVLAYCLEKFKDRTHVLNPIATTNRDYLYWEEGKFDGRLCMVDNLYNYCKNQLELKHVTKSNGITLPSGVILRKFPQRVVIHPTSSRPGKNWPIEKYLRLSEALKREGKEPVFILSKEEKKEWPSLSSPSCETLADLAKVVAESGSMIGNDSGIGHLASSLGLPTVTIARNFKSARFWRPGWAPGILVVPSCWIPNIKAFRLRDKYWKHWISVSRVLRTFLRLH